MHHEKIDITKLKKELKKNSLNLEGIKHKAIKTKKVIIICGPTCTGKSALAIELARILNTDLISLDSMQVYKGMDIGTDKYNTEKYSIKQYMTDIFEPDHTATAVEFRNICRELVDYDFFAKQRVPVMVGGSGLYIRAVVDDLDFVAGENTGQDTTYRKNLTKEIEEMGIETVYERLKVIDPEYAKKIGKMDSKRIIRALEVYNLTGLPFSSFQKKWNSRKSIYNCTMIGLLRDKNDISECITRRVEDMIAGGLIEEVKSLIAKGYKDCNSLKQAVGYKEVMDYIENGEIENIEFLKSRIISSTKKLAKKQITWFKADPRVYWISIDNCDNILNSIIKVLLILWSDL